MRSIEAIELDIALIKEAVRDAAAAGDEKEIELFYEDLEELREELYLAKTATV